MPMNVSMNIFLKGVYYHIADGSSNLANQMSSFYLYYAYGSTNSDLSVTSPYIFFTTGFNFFTFLLSLCAI